MSDLKLTMLRGEQLTRGEFGKKKAWSVTAEANGSHTLMGSVC